MSKIYFTLTGTKHYFSKYVFIVNRPKTENETVYYNVDSIGSPSSV